MSYTCELQRGYEHIAEYHLIGRDDEGNELERVFCCFEHGMLVINTNHTEGRPIPDCVITPTDGILLC